MASFRKASTPEDAIIHECGSSDFKPSSRSPSRASPSRAHRTPRTISCRRRARRAAARRPSPAATAEARAAAGRAVRRRRAADRRAAERMGGRRLCSKMGTVDSRPACDTCTKQKCCAQLQACDASAACKAAQACLAACASDDFLCVLQCSVTGGSGSDLLQEVGTCASQQCKTECPSSFDLDGGFDFDAF